MAKTILNFIQGAGFMIFVVGIALYLWDAPQDERIEDLTPLTAAALEATQAEEWVLVEGYISSDNPKLKGELMVYSYGRYDRNNNWHTQEGERPDLRVVVSDGVVIVGGVWYRLEEPPLSQEAPPPPDRVTGTPAKYFYRGFGANNPVLVIGRKEAAPHRIKADVLYGLSREELIASTQRVQNLQEWGSPIMIGGLLLFIGGFWLKFLVGLGDGLLQLGRRWLD